MEMSLSCTGMIKADNEDDAMFPAGFVMTGPWMWKMM